MKPDGVTLYVHVTITGSYISIVVDLYSELCHFFTIPNIHSGLYLICSLVSFDSSNSTPPLVSKVSDLIYLLFDCQGVGKDRTCFMQQDSSKMEADNAAKANEETIAKEIPAEATVVAPEKKKQMLPIVKGLLKANEII
ncbi:hypothetical protein NC651_034580 [Populus alba x Populus x berolinensis]|nr:hypothetical protein NC651_034580 [Populus alba x Populus x berolinensis]